MDIERWGREYPHTAFMRMMRSLTWIKVDDEVVDPLAVRFEHERNGAHHPIEIATSVYQTVHELQNCGMEIPEDHLIDWLRKQVRVEPTRFCTDIVRGIWNTVDTRGKEIKRTFFRGIQVSPPEPISPQWVWTTTERIERKNQSIVYFGQCVPHE